MNDEDRYEAGLDVRRAVLGSAHVDRSLANRTELTEEFQNLITRYAWGEIWTREGLPRHTRSLLTIAMMVALNRSEELALHLRAAKNNGVTREQIKEVLLQTAIYCGVPAANSAFHLADKLFREDDAAAARLNDAAIVARRAAAPALAACREVTAFRRRTVVAPAISRRIEATLKRDAQPGACVRQNALQAILLSLLTAASAGSCKRTARNTVSLMTSRQCASAALSISVSPRNAPSVY